MSYQLNDAEVRVLGALIEKEITTPDYYPLSLHSLVTACNQTSNREPVVHFDEQMVTEALDGLREQKLVHVVDRDGSRVVKYRHVVYETLGIGRPAIAVICVLTLRGPQTVGEIRTRTGRLYDFTSTEDVELTLGTLQADSPLVIRLPRQPGQKEVRYTHLLSGEITIPEREPERQKEPSPDRLSQLEHEVEELKRQFEVFRKQFE